MTALELDMKITRSLWMPPWSSVHGNHLLSWQINRRISQISPSQTPPFPVVGTCPPPLCACRATPTNLDIDRDRPLSGTMAPHTRHVVISTGKVDWKSRIEDEEGPNLARELKALLGPKGPYHDVCSRPNKWAKTPSLDTGSSRC